MLCNVRRQNLTQHDLATKWERHHLKRTAFLLTRLNTQERREREKKSNQIYNSRGDWNARLIMTYTRRKRLKSLRLQNAECTLSSRQEKKLHMFAKRKSVIWMHACVAKIHMKAQYILFMHNKRGRKEATALRICYKK